MAKALITAEERSALPEPVQAEYEAITDEKHPHKGRFLLKVSEVEGYEMLDARTLKATVAASRTDVDNVRRELGQTKASLEQATARVTELEQIDPKSEAAKIAEARVASVTTQMKAAHEKELGEAKATITRLDSGLRKALIESAAVSAIVEAKGRVALLKSVLMQECDIRTRKLDDGKDDHFAVVLDAAGNPRIADAQGNLMTIAQRVAEMKTQDDYAPAFAAEEARGGARHQPAAKPGTKPAAGRAAGEKTSLEKIRSGLAQMRGEAR